MASKREKLVSQFVNRTKGSERQGEKFKVVTKGGKRFHDYGGGRLIADKSGPSKPKTGTAAPAGAGLAPTPSTTGARPAAPSTGFTTGVARERLRERASGSGSSLNVAEASPRHGQRFDVVNKGGTRYHRYGPGRLFADEKRGAGTARFKPRARAGKVF